MNISKFQNIKISDIVEDLLPVDLVSIDIDGNLKKSPKTTISRNIDGGFANSIYLPTQKIDGGGA